MARRAQKKVRDDSDDSDEHGDGSQFYAAEQQRAKNNLRQTTATNQQHAQKIALSEVQEGERSEAAGEEGGRTASGRAGGRGGAKAATSRVASQGQQSAADDAPKAKLPMKRKICLVLEPDDAMAADAAALSRLSGAQYKRKMSVSAEVEKLMNEMSKITEGQPRKFCKNFIYMDPVMTVQSLRIMSQETVMSGGKGLDFWSPRLHSSQPAVRTRVNASMWNLALCYLLPFSGSFTWPFSGACHPKNHKNGMRSDW